MGLARLMPNAKTATLWKPSNPESANTKFLTVTSAAVDTGQDHYNSLFINCSPSTQKSLHIPPGPNMPSPLFVTTVQAAFMSALSNIFAQGIKAYRSEVLPKFSNLTFSGKIDV